MESLIEDGAKFCAAFDWFILILVLVVWLLEWVFGGGMMLCVLCSMHCVTDVDGLNGWAAVVVAGHLFWLTALALLTGYSIATQCRGTTAVTGSSSYSSSCSQSVIIL
jgi:hypothetical protein